MPKDRVPIPARTRRSLKIECGFRCSVPLCTNAIALEFHHMNGDPSDNRYENIIVLCAIHHAQATNGEIDAKACSDIKSRLRSQTAAFDYNALSLLIAEHLRSPQHLPDPIGEETDSIKDLSTAIEAEFGIHIEVALRVSRRLCLWASFRNTPFHTLKYLILGIACLVSGSVETDVIEIGPSDTHRARRAFAVDGLGVLRFRFDAGSVHNLAIKKVVRPDFWQAVTVLIGGDENSSGQSFVEVPFVDFERRIP